MAPVPPTTDMRAAQHGSALGITGEIKLKPFIVRTGCLWKLSPCSAEEQEQWQALSKAVLCQAAQITALWPEWLLYFHVCLKEGLGEKTCRCYSFQAGLILPSGGSLWAGTAHLDKGLPLTVTWKQQKNLFLIRSRCFIFLTTLKTQNATVQTFVKLSQSPVAPAAGENSRIQRILAISQSLCSPLPLKIISCWIKATETWALQNSSENFAVISH